PPRRRHDRRPAAHERRRARAPSPAAALPGREGGGRRGRGAPPPPARRPPRGKPARREQGLRRGDGRPAPARARRLGAGRVELVLHEGRKHQVKRMLAAVGYPVTSLHPSRYAGLTLEGLEPGAWRELEPSEVTRLRP